MLLDRIDTPLAQDDAIGIPNSQDRFAPAVEGDQPRTDGATEWCRLDASRTLHLDTRCVGTGKALDNPRVPVRASISPKTTRPDLSGSQRRRLEIEPWRPARAPAGACGLPFFAAPPKRLFFSVEARFTQRGVLVRIAVDEVQRRCPSAPHPDGDRNGLPCGDSVRKLREAVREQPAIPLAEIHGEGSRWRVAHVTKFVMRRHIPSIAAREQPHACRSKDWPTRTNLANVRSSWPLRRLPGSGSTPPGLVGPRSIHRLVGRAVQNFAVWHVGRRDSRRVT